MVVKIRLTRRGSTHHPFYRLVVADSRNRRDGRVVDTLGYYNPLPAEAEIKVDNEKALGWLQNGAQTSETARSILRQVGVWQRFQFLKQGMAPEQVDAEIEKILAGKQTQAEGRAKAAVEAAAAAKAKREEEAKAKAEAEAEAEAKAKAEAEAQAAAEAAADTPAEGATLEGGEPQPEPDTAAAQGE
jgi:small subunit ribosomal protein S16